MNQGGFGVDLRILKRRGRGAVAENAGTGSRLDHDGATGVSEAVVSFGSIPPA